MNDWSIPVVIIVMGTFIVWHLETIARRLTRIAELLERANK